MAFMLQSGSINAKGKIEMTYSIVAFDPDEQAWGVAVASKFLAVGAVVSYAKAGAGAVATQALCKMSFGPDGLALMAQGKSAQETLDWLLKHDPGAASRQVGMVDSRGSAASHTGSECMDWAGHRIGKGFACQGNILTGGDTLDAMVEAFTGAKGELADRLVAALLAGDTVGGDRRGKQSAAVIVARPGGGYGGDTDRYLDLRVDDDPEPVVKLQALLASHHLFFGRPRPEDLIPIDETIARELQALLIAQGYYKGTVSGIWDDASKQAFWNMVGSENLEERWNLDGETDKIDSVALNYLRERFQ
jgi:uncharacterized Ntn-hydrolase superfamily protein